MRRQLKLVRAIRATVESLEGRRLMWTGGLLEGDAASQLLQAKVRDDAGLTTSNVSAMLSQTKDAPEAAGLTLADIPYVSALSMTVAQSLTPIISAVSFRSFALNTGTLEGMLSVAPKDALAHGTARSSLPTLTLPTPDGGVARFGIERYDLLGPAAAAEFPEIQAVRLYGIDDPFAVGAATITGLGLSATISSPSGDWNVSPLVQAMGTTAHASYFFSNQVTTPEALDFDDDERLVAGGPTASADIGPEAGTDQTFSIGTQLKTLKEVIGVDAEWTANAGGQAAAFALVTSMVATANVALKRDVCAQLQLFSTTATIFTNSATDPYTDGDTDAMATQNIAAMTNAYGLANFDIGHAFGIGGGGVAFTFGGGVGSIGTSIKAQAASLIPTANSTPMQLRFMHETGHQLGASHTFNNLTTSTDTGRAADSAYEPGPGSTLMSYGGNGWDGNFVTLRDPVYHSRSIDQMDNGLRVSAASTGTVANTGNLVPQVTAPADRTIPANTPFELTAQAYDNPGDNLTYGWEQFDLGTEHDIGTDPGNGPIIRSRPPSSNPTRMFPELADILANRIDPDELLPTVSRTTDPLTFRTTVLDQLGGANDDAVDLTVVNTGAAFAITSQNSFVETWAAGSSQTITWNVAGTTANGINAAKVDIYISYDGGVTFSPMWLDTNNDGSETVTVPANAPFTGNARVKVKARGNYFFDINNVPILVSGAEALNGLPATAPAVELSLYGNSAGSVRDADQPFFGANASIDFAGDTDTYLFVPATTEAIIVDAARVGSNSVDPVLAVYDDLTGAQLAINDDDLAGGTVNSHLYVGVEAGHRYRISVGDYGSNDTGDVSLSIQGNVAAPTTAITLNAAGDGSATGTLASGNSIAFHQFFPPAVYDNTGTLTYAAPNSTLVASLYDAGNLLVAHSSNGTLSLAGLNIGNLYTLRIGVANYTQGGGAYTLNINLGTIATPGAPDLFSIYDSGSSNSDNITNVKTNVGFFINGIVGRYVQLYRDGVAVGAREQINSLGYAVPLDPGPVSDGSHVYTAAASLTATSALTPQSAGLTITIDTVAPMHVPGDDFSFRYDDGAGDQKFFVDFNEGNIGFDAFDPVVKNLTTGATLPSSDFSVTNYAGGFNDLNYNPTAGNDRVPSGNYTLTIPAGSVSDAAGNGNVQTVDTFFFQDGDANHDKIVNFSDLLALAQNYGQSSRTFSTGDMDYDGIVNFNDLLILAQHYGNTLPATLAPSAAADFTARAAKPIESSLAGDVLA